MAPNSLNNPNEALQIPDWINESYFHKILVNDVQDYVKVKSFRPIAATAPGENYTSIMIRVGVDIEMKDGSTQTKSYILKTCLDVNSKGGAFVSSLNLFPREQEMYETIIPNFIKLYKEAGVELTLAPKCLHIEQTSDRITLVMEDLGCKNFKNIDRLHGFDMPHISCVLFKLAELHAASAVYQEQNGPYSKLFTQTFFSEENRQLFNDIAKSKEESLLKAMRTWGLGEDIERYIQRTTCSTGYFDEALRINQVDPNEFNVLNHGDCWSNNVMFNYKDNGEIDETIFVDLQVGQWGTPAQDLWYMITNSASLNIRVKEFDTFIKIYHDRLTECLKLLGYKNHVPSLKDLHMMMIKYGFWGVLTAHGVMTGILLPTDKDANLDNMLYAKSEYTYKTFVNPYYAKAMCQLLPFFERKGLLEF